MKRGDKSSEGPIFPNPPQRPEEINFRLESDVWLRAQSWDTTRQGIFITRLGGLGSGEKSTAFELIHVDVLEKIWIPEGEKTENGKWKQEVTFKSSFQLNVSRFQTKWLEIENSIAKDNPASWQVAIFNADKLVDSALKERRFKGQTMGERMKAAQKTWSNANYIWSAHKIRNQLAHESDMKLTYELTLRSLSAFKQALKDLGAI